MGGGSRGSILRTRERRGGIYWLCGFVCVLTGCVDTNKWRGGRSGGDGILAAHLGNFSSISTLDREENFCNEPKAYIPFFLSWKFTMFFFLPTTTIKTWENSFCHIAE